MSIMSNIFMRNFFMRNVFMRNVPPSNGSYARKILKKDSHDTRRNTNHLPHNSYRISSIVTQNPLWIYRGFPQDIHKKPSTLPSVRFRMYFQTVCSLLQQNSQNIYTVLHHSSHMIPQVLPLKAKDFYLTISTTMPEYYHPYWNTRIFTAILKSFLESKTSIEIQDLWCILRIHTGIQGSTLETQNPRLVSQYPHWNPEFHVGNPGPMFQSHDHTIISRSILDLKNLTEIPRPTLQSQDPD